MRTRPLTAALLATLACSGVAAADEGMWPFDMAPVAAIQKDHNVQLSPAWLEHLRLSSARLSSGGSSSFVSKKGLLLTNHHVASDCIAKVARPGVDYMSDGFLASRDGGEIACPDLEALVLVESEDVTARVTAARKPGMTDAEANVAIKGEMARAEKECSDKKHKKCEVVTLYAGGRYHLYTYDRFTDVRLVFAPEADIAFFGGDPDNFTYPRFDLDMALFRVYANGKPLEPKHWLEWSDKGAKDGDVVFVSGHPGGTNRMSTVAQLEKLRDVTYPYYLEAIKRERDAVKRFADEGAEAKRESREAIFGEENSIKALTGYLGGLKDPALVAKRKTEEAALAAAIEKDPKLKAAYGTVFDDVKKVQAKLTPELYARYNVLERGADASLFGSARLLVRWHEETAQPNDKRLREYRDSNLETLKLELLGAAPIYGGVEVAVLRAWMERADRDLAKNDPLRAAIFHGETPERAARTLVAGSKLFDVYARRKLLEGGKAAIEASTDPMILLVRAIDGDARKLRKTYEDEIEAPMRALGEKVTQATFAVRGASLPPDATFTLRLATGVVKGYTEGGKAIPAATDFGGLYARATGKDPYKLPKRWLDRKAKVDAKVALNFVSTNDIIGGNSGSPVVDAGGKLVGLIFDGNLSSLPNRFVYREVTERAVSVDSAGMLHALRVVYDAGDLADELTKR